MPFFSCLSGVPEKKCFLLLAASSSRLVAAFDSGGEEGGEVPPFFFWFLERWLFKSARGLIDARLARELRACVRVWELLVPY